MLESVESMLRASYCTRKWVCAQKALPGSTPPELPCTLSPATGKLRAAQQKIQGPGGREYSENRYDQMQFLDKGRDLQVDAQ